MSKLAKLCEEKIMIEKKPINSAHASDAMRRVIAKSEHKYPSLRFFCTADMMKIVAYNIDELNEDKDLPETQESFHAKT